jgi:hypothetical protein
MTGAVVLVLLAGLAIPDVKGKDGTFTFDVEPRGDGVPCVSYEAPGGGGGYCFVAVGSGGWALETTYAASEHDVVFFGATIGRARAVRIGKVATLRGLRWSKRYNLRFFAGLVPRRAVHVPRNRIVALDRRGRLLGRQHWRDKHGHYGRCDGIWDRKHCAAREQAGQS